MDKRIIKLSCGYGDDAPIFHLRATSVAEDNVYASRFADIAENATEDERAAKEYGIYVNALAAWSEFAPTKVVDGTEVPLVPSAKTPAEAVKEYFKERTPENERIPSYVVANFRAKLQPSVRFL